MQAPPSCSGPSLTVTLAPFSCAVDAAQNVITCAPAVLSLTSNAGLGFGRSLLTSASSCMETAE